MTQQTDPNAGQGGTGASSAATQNTEHMIPKSRLDEALERARKAEEALQQHQTTTQEAEAARLAKQGEWQQIAENEKKAAAELKPFKDRAEALEKAIRDGNEARIKQVPEANMPLIPVDYPPERLAAYLDANWTRLTNKAAPNIDAGAGGAGGAAGGSTTLTQDEAEHAARVGMTPEQWVAARKKANNGKV